LLLCPGSDTAYEQFVRINKLYNTGFVLFRDIGPVSGNLKKNSERGRIAYMWMILRRCCPAK
jgi:hypothetical protein